MQPAETGMAVLQLSPASVNIQRPDEVDPALSKRRHTLPEPLSLSTAQCSLEWERGLYAATVSLAISGWFWRIWFYGQNLMRLSPSVHTGNDCYTSVCIHVSAFTSGFGDVDKRIHLCWSDKRDNNMRVLWSVFVVIFDFTYHKNTCTSLSLKKKDFANWTYFYVWKQTWKRLIYLTQTHALYIDPLLHHKYQTTCASQ